MKKRSMALSLIIAIIGIACFSSLSYAKPMPSEFSDLIKGSDLIVIANVFEIKSQGKSMPGMASATVNKIIIGDSKSKILKIRWDGIAITELGEWVFFLTKDPNRDEGSYKPTYGVRSFWKIEYADIKNKECCAQFVVLRQHIGMLKFDSSLLGEQLTYIDGVPSDKNPIKVRGLLVDKLATYIKKERQNENESR
ncbi:MAG: hypothetical protein L3J98_17610 [Gammaproteobacteria bacterium]|nr:hypothetical protein [Gammaproteobacteria bacterium]MCF6261941.1 hypothetical protein [Gammaproteobacteria bacterium]